MTQCAELALCQSPMLGTSSFVTDIFITSVIGLMALLLFLAGKRQ